MATAELSRPSRGRQLLATLVGIAVAAALLVWSLRGVHPGEVARHIRDAHPAPLFLAVIVATLTFPIRMVRWRLLLRDESGGPLPAAALWHAVAIGFMANNILPFRAGELVRTCAIRPAMGAGAGVRIVRWTEPPHDLHA